ncbi:MAG: DUF2334 domain-containing protein [Clostridium sp.]|uniref:DUF2334 domain-containing protein n=2 Tax=Clostridia TaxID=186801 RepID=UPI002FCA4626
MMYKKYIKNIFFILFSSILIITINNTNAYADSKKDKILLLYDAYKEYGSNDNTLSYVNNMAISTGSEVDILNIQSYKKGVINDYKKIIVLSNKENTINGVLGSDIQNFNGNIFWIGDNYDNFKNKKNISYISESNLYSNSQSKLFSALGYGKDLKNKKYLLIDNVTPFIELNDLVNKIDYLYNNGIQFIISAIPVFENADFNSMKRFTEVLRYAESRGGTIVMHGPYLQNKDAPANDITSAIMIGYQNYLNYWVYPVALDMPQSFLYRDDMKPFLKKYNTVFLQENKDVGILDFGAFKNNQFNNVIQKINYKNINNSDYKDFQNIAVSIDNKIPYKEFMDIVNGITDKEIYFNNPSYINAKVTINGEVLTAGGTGIYLNNNPVTQNTFINNKEFEKAISKNDKENNVEKKQDTINISKPRKVVVAIASIVCIIFLVIVILSRKIDKRKYFK